jgi:hypothetical protein
MTSATHLIGDSMEMTWHPESRLAIVQVVPGITLGDRQGAFLVESLLGWIGTEGKAFGLLAGAKGIRGADSAYRVRTRDFFKRYRASANVAVTDMGPVIRIVGEMFRIGTGIQLKGFSDEASARAWLRERGIAA